MDRSVPSRQRSSGGCSGEEELAPRGGGEGRVSRRLYGGESGEEYESPEEYESLEEEEDRGGSDREVYEEEGEEEGYVKGVKPHEDAEVSPKWNAPKTAFSQIFVDLQDSPKELRCGLIEIAKWLPDNQLVFSNPGNEEALLVNFSKDVTTVTPKKGYFTVSSTKSFPTNTASASPTQKQPKTAARLAGEKKSPTGSVTSSPSGRDRLEDFAHISSEAPAVTPPGSSARGFRSSATDPSSYSANGASGNPVGASHHHSTRKMLFGLTRGNALTVVYNDITAAFRALGRLLGCVASAVPASGGGDGMGRRSRQKEANDKSDSLMREDDEGTEPGREKEGKTTATAVENVHNPQLRLKEHCRFETAGAMFDVSRNAVLTLDTLKFFVRKLALMGINTMMLYMEDVFEVPGEPFFGHLRGKYSLNELRTLDRYAELFNITVIPCIQTLGHLGQVLQWPAYFSVQDTKEVLLVKNKETYDLIEKVLRSVSAPFRSNCVHIGFDETQGLGTGRFKDLYAERAASASSMEGYRNETGTRGRQRRESQKVHSNPNDEELYYEHLLNVIGICRGLGIKPLVWSDMMIGYQREQEASKQNMHGGEWPFTGQAPLGGGGLGSQFGSDVYLGRCVDDDVEVELRDTMDSESYCSSVSCSMDVDNEEAIARRNRNNSPEKSMLSGADESNGFGESPAAKYILNNRDKWPLIPEIAELVFWNYYCTHPHAYSVGIDCHLRMNYYDDIKMPNLSKSVNDAEISGAGNLYSRNRQPWMAGGIWTWNRLWSALPFSFAATKACVQACRARNVKNIFMTMWGDDGSECDILSSLPGLQYYADLAYAENIENVKEEHLNRNFLGTCQGGFNDFICASLLDGPTNEKSYGFDQCMKPIRIDTTIQVPCNLSKWLLWQDPLLGHLDPQLGDSVYAISDHYSFLAETLSDLAKKENLSLNSRLEFPAQVARVLVRKVKIRTDLLQAYRKRDLLSLTRIMKDDLEPLQRDVEHLWLIHRKLWLKTCKPFGLEVLEARYGYLRTRLEGLWLRLSDYINACNAKESSLNPASAEKPKLRKSAVELPVRGHNDDNMFFFENFSANVRSKSLQKESLYQVGEMDSPSPYTSIQEHSFSSSGMDYLELKLKYFSMTNKKYDMGFDAVHEEKMSQHPRIEEFEESNHLLHTVTNDHMSYPSFYFARCCSTSRCMGTEPYWM
eukprot:Nk52_evm105s208 gene=Nk52_evmTU105s208